jgi:chaperonin GroES
MSTTIRPLTDRIVVQHIEAPKKSPGGLTLVSDDKGTPSNATVVAVGPGRVLDNGTRVRPEIETGQKVLVQAYAGTEVELDGVKYSIVREAEILAVFGPLAAG